MSCHKGDLKLRILFGYNATALALAAIGKEIRLLQLIAVKIVTSQNKNPDGIRLCFPRITFPGRDIFLSRFLRPQPPGLHNMIQGGFDGSAPVVVGPGAAVHAVPLIGRVVGIDDDRILDPFG